MLKNANAAAVQSIVLKVSTTRPGTIRSVNANALKTQLNHVAFHNTLIMSPATACVRPSPVPKTNTGIQEAATASESIAIAQLVIIII